MDKIKELKRFPECDGHIESILIGCRMAKVSFQTWDTRELDVENSHTKGHWIIVFTSKGCETQVDFTAYVDAKQLSMRPVGKSVFEQTYMKKAQTQFITDLKKALG